MQTRQGVIALLVLGIATTTVATAESIAPAASSPRGVPDFSGGATVAKPHTGVQIGQESRPFGSIENRRDAGEAARRRHLAEAVKDSDPFIAHDRWKTRRRQAAIDRYIEQYGEKAMVHLATNPVLKALVARLKHSLQTGLSIDIPARFRQLVEKYDLHLNAPQTPAERPAVPALSSDLAAASTLASDLDSAAPIHWLASLALAEWAARYNNEAYLVYFCDERSVRCAGESAAIRAQYKRDHSGVSPPCTPFDDARVVDALEAAGIRRFVKIACTGANVGLLQKHNASENTLIIFGPEGTPLKVFRKSEVAAELLLNWLRNEFKPLKSSAR